MIVCLQERVEPQSALGQPAIQLAARRRSSVTYLGGEMSGSFRKVKAEELPLVP